MKRRELVRLLSYTSVSAICGCASAPFRQIARALDDREDAGGQDIGETQAPATGPQEEKPAIEAAQPAQATAPEDPAARSVRFMEDFPQDVVFEGQNLELLKSLTLKLRAVQKSVGYGNFNIIGMDELFRVARLASGSGDITVAEKSFLEELYFFDAKKYGFQGERVVTQFTEALDAGLVTKVPHTGHFLRKGRPVETYESIRKDVGDSIVLTSGIRGIAKQFHLFFEKALESKGNLSKASRALAPPGYSFHWQGDFDIGRVGFGHKNFTEEFASTDEYKKLSSLGYVQIRYAQANHLGVRFEPWHIKIRDEG